MESFEAAVLHLKTILASNDILLTLGAGDVWKVGEMLLKEL
jgi:UDP-N-acetylmuramate--alanine ligase